MARTIGRPRARASATGEDTRTDILRAAASLFTTIGYGGVSTHRIAAEARISQPTLYHYFSGKHEILLELLLTTVQPSVDFATGPDTVGLAPAARLAALCQLDVTVLLSGEHHISSLYLLPELADERFAPFAATRDALYAAYRDRVAELLGVAAPEAHDRASLVFGLVESTILRRRTESGLDAAVVGPDVADAALAILGVGAEDRVRAVAEGRAAAAAVSAADR